MVTFKKTKEILSQVENESEQSMDGLLGIITKDIYDDFSDSGYEHGYDDLPVVNDTEFASRLINLVNHVARIYEKNKDCFTEDRMKKRWDKANDKIKEFTEKKDALSVEIEKIKELNLQLEGKIKEYDAIENARDVLKAEEQRLQNLLDELQTITGKTQLVQLQIPDTKERLDEYTFEYTKLQEEFDSLQKEEITKRNECNDLEQQLFEQRESANRLLLRRDELGIELQELEEEKNGMDSEIAEYMERISAVSSIVSEFKNGNVDKEKKYQSLQEELEQLKKDEIEIKAKCEELGERVLEQKRQSDDLIQKRDELSVELEEVTEEKNQINSEVMEIKRSIETLNESVLNLQGENNEKLRKQQELQNIMSQLQSDEINLKNELQRLNVDLYSQNNLVAELKQKKIELEQSNVNVEDLYNELSQLSNQCRENENKVHDLNREIRDTEDKSRHFEMQRMQLEQQYKDTMRDINEERKLFAQQKSNTQVVLSEYQNFVKAYTTEQEWIAKKTERILKLLNGDILLEVWNMADNSSIKQLSDSIEKKKDNISRELNRELADLNDLLKKFD